MRRSQALNDKPLTHDTLNTTCFTQQQYIGPARGKQAIGHNADNGVNARFHGNRVFNHKIKTVDNMIAVIRDDALTVDRVDTQFHQLTGHVERAMGMTSTGKGKSPSVATYFEPSAMQIKRLAQAATIFSRVSAAPPPLIMVTVSIYFVGAVDVEGNGAYAVEFKHFNAQAFQALGTGF